MPDLSQSAAGPDYSASLNFSGASYYRARYYDAGVGRFVNEDPIGFAGGINYYRYVRNSPVRFLDPLGRWTIQIGVSFNYTLPFGVTGSVGAGFAIDGHGHIGTYTMHGLGLGEGVGASGGVSVGVSNGKTVCALTGPFLNVSGTGGVEGLAGTGDYFTGRGDGPGGIVDGGGVTFGIGGGASSSAQRTVTSVHSFGGCSCTNGGEMK
jgi:RHS repeat-associated protein